MGKPMDDYVREVTVFTIITIVIITTIITFTGSGGLGTCAIVHMWRSRDNLNELVLFPHLTGFRDQIQIIRLGGRHL